MTFIWDDSQFVNIINLYKKSEYWTDILETAGNNVIDDIENDAKRLAPKDTGQLENSIVGSVSTSGNNVNFLLTSSHPAASIIEFGGYSPFPPWEEVGGVLPFPVAKKVFENQPFKAPQPYIRPALINNLPRLEKEVVKVAQKKI
tara:strand:+ start:245 stop:679 length:435 start_codon:yes stop_codon:yes gene_type:complete